MFPSRYIAFVSCSLFLTVPVAALPPAAPGAGTSRFRDAEYAQAVREDGDSIYEGTIKSRTTDEKGQTTLVLWLARVTPPTGKPIVYAPPRTKTVRLTSGVALRTADPTDLQATTADLVPGASVYAVSHSASGETAVLAHAVLLRTGEGAAVPNSLLEAKTDVKNWQSHFDDNAPGSRVSQDGNALKITVAGNPTRDWQAQLYRDTPIEAGKTYTLRFRARAETRHFLTVGSQVEDDGPYRNLGLLETVLVTPQWQTFQFTFTSVDSVVPGKSRLPVFSAGQGSGIVSLANIALVPGALPLPPSVQARKAALESRAKSGENLLTDNNDANAWFLYSSDAARGVLTQDTGPGGGPVLKVHVAAASTQPWHLILMQPSRDLEEGQEYTLRFLARADRIREMEVQSQISKGDFHNIGLSEKVQLGTTWKPYTLRFTTSRTLPDQSRLPQFCLAAEGDVWLANVSLVRGK